MKISKYLNDLPDNFVINGDLAIDTETTGLNLNRDRLCVLQMSNGDGNSHLVTFEPGAYGAAKNLKALLSDKDRVFIFHYARFDVAVISRFLGVMIENIYCTKISSKIARTYSDLHGLRDICQELLGVKISKQQQSSYWGAENLSQEQLEYASNDVLHLHRLREALNKIRACPQMF